jgi:voltage-gated potassium channel
MDQRRAYEIIQGRSRQGLAKVFDLVMIALILVSVLVALLATNRGLLVRYEPLFLAAEVGCGLAFTAEYVLRVWVCTEDRRNRYRDPVRGRLRYMLTPLSLIDLFAILPFWLALTPQLTLEQLWVLRATRILKLLRYSSALETLGTVIHNERGPLQAAVTIMLTLLVLLSSLIFVVESDAQPAHFGSVPDSMWWGIVTLSTVGYGDVVPITPLGRIIGGFAVVLGMGLFALPAGILANGFAAEMRRRNFVVTWNLVAGVPFFENLPATRIAEIAAVLQPQVAVPGEIIVDAGERGDCMYFIISGEVEVKLPAGPVQLRAGDFFGEIALLTDSPRTATVVATTTCQLLLLRVRDFRKMLAANEDLRETIARVAQQRLAAPADRFSVRGDSLRA